jgi:ATP synthase protein I
MSANSPEDRRSKDNDRGLMPIWRLSSIGIEMGVAVFVGWLMGHYLDKWLHTDPWLMIVFILLGVAAGFKGMVSAAREATADANRRAPHAGGEVADPTEKPADGEDK